MSVYTNPKRKGGRPKLEPSEKRTLGFKVKFTLNEYLTFAERAEQAGLANSPATMGKFARLTLLGQQVNSVPTINRDLVKQMNYIGVNLNQLVRRGDQVNLQAIESMQNELSVIAKKILGL